MPVYEYRCPDCSDIFEKLVPFSAASRDVQCPTCGTQASKLVSTFAAMGTAGGSSASAGMQTAPSPGGGCCGGGCCS